MTYRYGMPYRCDMPHSYDLCPSDLLYLLYVRCLLILCLLDVRYLIDLTHNL